MDFSTNNNIITAYGTIVDGDARRFEGTLSQLSGIHDRIIIRVHTYGGNVFEGNQMCNALANCTADVELHVVGVAASMGAILTLYCEKVFIAENGFLMFHAPFSQTHGTAKEHESSLQLLRLIEDSFVQTIFFPNYSPNIYIFIKHPISQGKIFCYLSSYLCLFSFIEHENRDCV